MKELYAGFSRRQVVAYSDITFMVKPCAQRAKRWWPKGWQQARTREFWTLHARMVKALY